MPSPEELAPFNDSDWFRKDENPRWRYGLPPRGNANFACVQHFIHQLAPTGMAGFVLARFWFWVKHPLQRANSREETGNTFCAFSEARRTPSIPRERFATNAIS